MRTKARKRATPLPEPKQEAVALSNSYVRKWAQSRGMKVSAKGRIPVSVMKAYNERDKDDVTQPEELEVFHHKGKDIPDPSRRMKPTGKTMRKRVPCGFCCTNPARHDLCPGAILNGKLVANRVHVCVCFERKPGDHPRGRVRYAEITGKEIQ